MARVVTPASVVARPAVPTITPAATGKAAVAPTLTQQPSVKPAAAPVAKPAETFVQPAILPVLNPPTQAHTLKDALKQIKDTLMQLAPTSGHLFLKPKEKMAIPDIPIPIQPRPYGSYPLSSPFYLAEKPPEGHASPVDKVKAHLKERPPIHEPEEVIAEDLSIRGAKER
jgi:hypothetical protein